VRAGVGVRRQDGFKLGLNEGWKVRFVGTVELSLVNRCRVVISELMRH
jgi:hypothetical protein